LVHEPADAGQPVVATKTLVEDTEAPKAEQPEVVQAAVEEAGDVQEEAMPEATAGTADSDAAQVVEPRESSPGGEAADEADGGPSYNASEEADLAAPEDEGEGESLSVEPRSVEALSVEARSVEARSVEARSVEALSVEALSVEARSVEALSVEALSVEARSVEARSVEGRSVEGRSVEARSVEARSVEARSVEALLFETAGDAPSIVLEASEERYAHATAEDTTADPVAESAEGDISNGAEDAAADDGAVGDADAAQDDNVAPATATVDTNDVGAAHEGLSSDAVDGPLDDVSVTKSSGPALSEPLSAPADEAPVRPASSSQEAHAQPSAEGDAPPVTERNGVADTDDRHETATTLREEQAAVASDVAETHSEPAPPAKERSWRDEMALEEARLRTGVRGGDLDPLAEILGITGDDPYGELDSDMDKR
jgi:hypothetical protein